MEPIDRNGPGEHGPDDPAVAPAPIVIVQRGRPTWGRELLLLLFLLSAGGYIAYQEYRGPTVVFRDGPRDGGRIIDAVAIAPVADGAIVLRAAEDEGRPVDPPALAPAPSPPADDPEPPRPPDPAPPDAVAVAVAGPPDDGPPPDPFADLPAADAAPAPDDVDDGLPPLPELEPWVAGPLLADAAPARPRRASSTIALDRERLEGPPPAPPARPARAPTDPPDPEWWPGADEPAVDPREPRPHEEYRPPTLAQRHHFLQCVSVTIRQYGLGAGPYLEGLCQDFGAALPPELDLVGQRLGSGFVLPGSDVEQTIAALRRVGAPEPYLLQRLSEQMTRTIGARHGPRNHMEARVFAARKLLAVPLADPGDGRP